MSRTSNANPQTLTELMARRVAVGGIALIDRDKPVSAAALDEESRRVAQGLHDLGVREGDRVAVWLPNVPAWPACFFAAARLGAIVVAVNTRFRSNEIADIVGRSGANVLIYWPGYRGIDFDGILRDAGVPALKDLKAIVAYGEPGDPAVDHKALGKPVTPYGDLAASAPYPHDHARPDLGCLIFTTSGTTKLPKFVLHHQASIASHAAEAARGFGYGDEGAVTLLTVPMCGTFGMSHALSPIAGSKLLVMMTTFEVHAAARAIKQYNVTHLPATGDIVAQLLGASKEPIPYPTIRAVMGVRAGQARPAEARGLKLMGIYGSSELQAVLSIRPVDLPPEQREIGGGKLITAATRVRTRSNDTGKILPHGEHGELEFKGPSMLMGYFGNAEATQAAFTEDGWFKTGDIGVMDERGYFKVVDRKKDMVLVSGFNVYPNEVEDVVATLPGVLECAVVGIPDERTGEAVKLVVVRKDSTLSEDKVREFCRANLTGYKVPKVIEFRNDLPKTPVGKVLRRELRDERVKA